MKFQPGQSGNPSGRPPKGQSLAECLRRELAVEVKGRTRQERIARVVVALAMRGEMDAVRFLTDRTDGKVPDRVQQEGVTVIKVVYEDAAGLTR